MKYRISLTKIVTECTTLHVEADDQESAEYRAIELACMKADDFGNPVIWEFLDDWGDAEVIMSEEWPPVPELDTELSPS